MLQFYVYNSLLVLMSASNNQVKLLKKLSSDLKVLDSERCSYLINDPTALNGSRLVTSDGGTVENSTVRSYVRGRQKLDALIVGST